MNLFLGFIIYLIFSGGLMLSNLYILPYLKTVDSAFEQFLLLGAGIFFFFALVITIATTLKIFAKKDINLKFNPEYLFFAILQTFSGLIITTTGFTNVSPHPINIILQFIGSTLIFTSFIILLKGSIAYLKIEHQLHQTKKSCEVALAKQQPQKPFIGPDEINPELVNFYCPDCEQKIVSKILSDGQVYWILGHKQRHCCFCGKALDWSEDNTPC